MIFFPEGQNGIPYMADGDILWLQERDTRICWRLDVEDRIFLDFLKERVKVNIFNVVSLETPTCKFCKQYPVAVGWKQIDFLIYSENYDDILSKWSWWPVDSPDKVMAAMTNLDHRSIWVDLHSEFALGLR